MKKLIFMTSVFLLFTATMLAQTKAVVIYDSDEARSSMAAAILNNKFSADLIDVNGKLAAVYGAELSSLTDSAYHKAFIVCDTIYTDVAGNFRSSYIDSLDLKLAVTTTYLGTAPDASHVLVEESGDTLSVPQQVWDRSDVYSGIEYPLILHYLSYQGFLNAQYTATSATDTTVNNSAQTYTADVFNGDYLFIISGTGIGQYGVVEDVRADSLVELTAALTTTPAIGDRVVIKNSTHDHEFWYDIYSELYIEAELADVATTMQFWRRLIDDNRRLNITSGVTAQQDLTYLRDTVLSGGQLIFDYLKR